MKSVSKLPRLKKFSKCWDQTQGSMKPAFNKQTQAQADEAKTRRSSSLVLPTSARVASENQTRAWASHWRFNSEEA